METSLSKYKMKKILVINSGSSSIKFQLIEMPLKKVIVKGMIDAIGTNHSSFILKNDQINVQQFTLISNHENGLNYIIKSLLEYKIVMNYDEINACGHRVAHGGESFKESTIINDREEIIIDKLGILAPLHNPMNLLGYQILKKILPKAIHVAVFDTSFHQTLKEDTFVYPIPYEYYKEDHIRKYGFHGTSCKYISLKVNEELGEGQCQRLIVCHLGNGASVTAICNGVSIDTSMGLTPLGGVAMGSRCGDIDPSVVEYIAQLQHKSVSEVLSELNYKSGLLGLSGKSFDMRVLCEDMTEGNQRSQLSIDVYIKRIVDYIGSYYFHLGGLDTLVFTAGIGENSAIIREHIINKIKGVLNINLDTHKNNHCEKDFEIISTSDSQANICVVKTDEEMMIASDTYHLLKE